MLNSNGTYHHKNIYYVLEYVKIRVSLSVKTSLLIYSLIIQLKITW